MLQVNLGTQRKRTVQRVAGSSASPPTPLPANVPFTPASPPPQSPFQHAPVAPAAASWQWQDDGGGFTPYAPHVNAAIEHAYALKQKKFDLPQSPYRIVFSQNMQVLCVFGDHLIRHSFRVPTNIVPSPLIDRAGQSPYPRQKDRAARAGAFGSIIATILASIAI